METAHPKRRRWLRLILLIALVVCVVDESLSLVLRYSSGLNRRITARLEAAFGRPVEVSRYDFSLFPTPRLIADSIRVAEDPRFGNEYFLRADSLAASVRWRSLLRGRAELGTLSLTRPSLNLVHGSNDSWNLEEWLPHGIVATATGGTPSAAPVSARPRLSRIEVNAGRINFKQASIKLPLALVDVAGAVEQESPGRWRLDLEARPMRAAVIVQEAGTLALHGVVGGTSFRLRPADLELSWADASLSDLLRLLRGRDYGFRGACSVLLTARSDGPQWSLVASAQFRRLHRWDLSLRADNPAVNVNLSANWWPEESRIDLVQALVEAPRSNLRATGEFAWPDGTAARRGNASATAGQMRLQLRSSNIRLEDLLAWFRAFHPGIADELAATGAVAVDATLSGWPPHVEQAVVTSEAARFEGASLSEPIRMGRAEARIDRDRVVLGPATIAFGVQTDSVRLELAAHQTKKWSWDTRATGKFAEVEDLFGLAAAFGVTLPRGWSLEGPAQFELRWQDTTTPFRDPPSGRIESSGLTLRAPFLNQPVTQVKILVELRPGDQRFHLDSAEAFGARWSGSLERRSGAPWNFSLAADRLDAADLDHWLNPQWRESLLQRVLPLLGGSRTAAAIPGGLEARGNLVVDAFLLAPLELHHLRADASLSGRRIELKNAEADFFGGTVRGSARAELVAEPAYHIEAKFDRVNLADFVHDSPALQNRFSGIASGGLTLSAHGLGRPALFGSLAGRGSIEVRDATIRGFNLEASVRAQSRQAGVSAFQRVAGGFSIADARVQFAKLKLENGADALEVTGNVDFARTLDLRVQILPPAAPGSVFRLTGPLDSFQLTRLATPAL